MTNLCPTYEQRPTGSGSPAPQKALGASGLQRLWGQGQSSDQGQWLTQLGTKAPDTRTPGQQLALKLPQSYPTPYGAAGYGVSAEQSVMEAGWELVGKQVL